MQVRLETQFGAGMMLKRGVMRLHPPYASMNWIRFNGSLRCLISQP